MGMGVLVGVCVGAEVKVGMGVKVGGEMVSVGEETNVSVAETIFGGVGIVPVEDGVVIVQEINIKMPRKAKFSNFIESL
jgi:hypothetical protein